MAILTTFPGKFGDLLWALPTLRALARRTGEAIDLLTSADMASICPLISAQPYVGRCYADPRWVRVHIDTEDRLPPPPAADHGYDQIFHLGYRGWPQRPLPFETLDCLNEQLTAAPYLLIEGNYCKLQDAELCLEEPWITVFPPCQYAPDWASERGIAVGFSDEHFELKYGLFRLIYESDYRLELITVGNSPRWSIEAGEGEMNWSETVKTIQTSAVFLGCNSGLHVLAVACGTPVVLMEPSPARHNPIFFPLGTTGPQVTLVLGNDGLPTWDARHVADTLTTVLERSPHATRRRQEAPRG